MLNKKPDVSTGHKKGGELLEHRLDFINKLIYSSRGI